MRSFPHILICLVTLAVSLSGPVRAEQADVLTMVNAIGSLIAAEKTCGLSFDAAAVQKWVEDHVPESDTQFTALLNLSIGGAAAEQADMSPTGKIALCTQAKRSAKANGFVK